MKVPAGLFCLLSLLIFAGCNLRPRVAISGDTTGVASGVVAIEDENGTTVNAGNINNNKFEIGGLYIERPGYYSLVLCPEGRPKLYYPLYLETANYSVNFAANRNYPAIKSTSQIQNELSAYNAIKDSLGSSKKQAVARLRADLDRRMSSTDPEEFSNALNKLSEEENSQSFSLDADALDIFMKQFPDNRIAAHMMVSMKYENDPDKYYSVYSKFNAYNKEASEGKELGEKLAKLVKLKEGAIAPAITGLTPQGQKVDIRKLNTRLILVEFWRAGSSTSRINHQEMVMNPFDTTGRILSIISVSFDTKRDWWLTSAKDDKINWTQVSDLKGNGSPNAKNWAVSILPTYYLLDARGRIIEREIPFSSIRAKLGSYLRAH